MLLAREEQGQCHSQLHFCPFCPRNKSMWQSVWKTINCNSTSFFTIYIYSWLGADQSVISPKLKRLREASEPYSWAHLAKGTNKQPGMVDVGRMPGTNWYIFLEMFSWLLPMLRLCPGVGRGGVLTLLLTWGVTLARIGVAGIMTLDALSGSSLMLS